MNDRDHHYLLNKFYVCEHRKFQYVIKSYALVKFLLFVGSGTGSYPNPPHGLQLNILLADKYEPFMGPCFFNASIVYREQVGV